ncbi:MAG TPA: hypothetical protein PLC81_06640 [Bacteroidales bacterium]|nr:hypothetical protein [Bacteroidales bacterium]HQH41738.1 hypothetical protein [Bacteroidales bacterium]HQK37291.1 hypothetical protein [Bacteroidales bacterium]
MPISELSSKDLMLDACFQKWALQSGNSDCRIWSILYEELPEMREKIDEAKTLLQRIYRVINDEIDEDAEKIWKRIKMQIDPDKE